MITYVNQLPNMFTSLFTILCDVKTNIYFIRINFYFEEEYMLLINY